MNHVEARSIVNAETTPSAVLDRILADDFQSVSSQPNWATAIPRLGAK
jgi:hypothetical protein